MSLRRVVQDLLGADGSGTDGLAPGDDRAAAALEAAGHGELEPELYGEALVHFADTAPLEQADALSSIVTGASAVPLDPELDPTMPVEGTVDDVAPTNEGRDGTEGTDPSDDDPDLLDSDLIESDGPAVDATTAIDERLATAEADASDASGSTRSPDGFGSGAGNDPTARSTSDAPDAADTVRVDGEVDGATSLAGMGEPGPEPDPLDPFDAGATHSPDESGLVDDLDLTAEPGDIDPDLLLDE